jgi:hypothetical protein
VVSIIVDVDRRGGVELADGRCVLGDTRAARHLATRRIAIEFRRSVVAYLKRIFPTNGKQIALGGGGALPSASSSSASLSVLAAPTFPPPSLLLQSSSSSVEIVEALYDVLQRASSRIIAGSFVQSAWFVLMMRFDRLVVESFASPFVANDTQNVTIERKTE